jgi:hypothetical protein
MEFVTTESIDTQLYDLIRENTLHRFASELQYTSSEDEERKNTLRYIINCYTAKTEESKKTDARNKLDKMYNNMEENFLKKKWSSLTASQKEDRIKAFVKESEDGTTDYEEQLLQMLEKGTLKQSYLEYDHHKGVIVSINIPEKVEKVKTIKKKKSK